MKALPFVLSPESIIGVATCILLMAHLLYRYAEGTPEYDINLSRHEVRTLSHPDVVYEKSLLIRQRLLNYKGS